MKTRIKNKLNRRAKIRKRIRKQISGNAERPRLVVFKSSKHVYAQIVDDEAGRVLFGASSTEKEGREIATRKARAKFVGESLAAKLLEKGCEKIVFDRGSYPYHGIVAALAEAAREKGIKF